MCYVIIFFVKKFILIKYNCFVSFASKFKDFKIIVSLTIITLIFAFNSLFFIIIILILRRYKSRNAYKRVIIMLKSRIMFFSV